MAKTRIEGLYDPLSLSADVLQKLIRYLHEELWWAGADRTDFIKQLRRADELYEERDRRTKNTPFEDASDIHLPLAATHASAIHSRLYTTLFAQDPFFTLRALDSQIRDHIGGLQTALQWVLKDLVPWENEIHTWLADITRYPLGALRIAWDQRRHDWTHYNAEGKVVTDKAFLVKSAPDVKAWAPDDLFWPATYESVSDMPWISFRTWMSEGQGRRLQAEGRLFHVDASIAVQPDRRTAGIILPEGLEVREMREIKAGVSPTYARLLQFHEIWCHFDINGDGIDEFLKVVLDPNLFPDPKALKLVMLHPFHHQRFPLVTATYERRPHTITGIPVTLQVGHLNDELDTIHNQVIDAAHVAICDLIFHPPGAAFADQLRRIFPGKRIPVPAPEAVVSKPLGTLKATSFALEGLIRQYAERRTFLSDFAMGREPSPARRGTASGTLAIIQEGNRHFNATVKDVREALREAGYQVLELVAQLLPREHIERALGPAVARDVEAVLRTPVVPLRSLVGVEVTATSALVNQDMQRQNSILLFQIATTYFNQLMQLAGQMSAPGIPPQFRRLVNVLAEKTANLVGDISKTFERRAEEIVPDAEEIRLALAEPGPVGVPVPPGLSPLPGPATPASPGGSPIPTGFFTAPPELGPVGGPPISGAEPAGQA